MPNERFIKPGSGAYQRYKNRNMHSGRIDPQITTTVVCRRRLGGTDAGTKLLDDLWLAVVARFLCLLLGIVSSRRE